MLCVFNKCGYLWFDVDVEAAIPAKEFLAEILGFFEADLLFC